ncbi:uncharacterized protein OCT59_008989 [Rhizophagus irregularis]|uniref:Uncharacterized protein n=1 Tax=Rhizophagus irregularis (strain DAOM 197198w) TaxID=1432141 RepID=A0A015IBQ4_RHIIW|nr:hypothetical protein RirG_263250 [Rhizophagus irregularis DAOM 197198w]UZO17641.1 hypothetical protein OCT59_008989 [Rhizophagus irregularis]
MKNSNEIRSAATIATKSTKVRPKVPCHCKKCNSKLVDTRTKQKHEQEEKRLQAYISKRKDDKEKTSNKAPSDSKKHSRSVPIGIKTIVAASSQNACDDNIVMINDNHDQNVATSSQSLHDGDIVMIDDNNDRSDEDFHNQNPTNVRKKRRRYDRYQKNYDHTTIIPENELEQEVSSSDGEGSHLFNDDDAARDNDQEHPNMNVNMSDSWILLWIFKYQERFKLTDVAINSLTGFFALVLKDVDSNRFEKFPSTIYMARKLLEIKKSQKPSRHVPIVTNCMTLQR